MTRTGYVEYPGHKARRDELKSAGLCINNAAHGPATFGVLCEPCRLLHRYGPSRRPTMWQRVDMLGRELNMISRTPRVTEFEFQLARAALAAPRTP